MRKMMLVSLPCLCWHWDVRGKTESGLWLSVLILCFDFRPHGGPFMCFSAHFVNVCGLSWTVTLEISTCGVHLSLKNIALVVSSVFLYIHSYSFLSLSTPPILPVWTSVWNCPFLCLQVWCLECLFFSDQEPPYSMITLHEMAETGIF